jgi:hypothetical protein
MRQETKDIMKAFLKRTSRRCQRTTTDGDAVYLHGNRIAWRESNGDISMTLAGWGTPTTRERLNGLCMLLIDKRPFNQRKHEQFYNDDPIDTTQVITIHTIVPVEMNFDQQRAWYDTSAELN